MNRSLGSIDESRGSEKTADPHQSHPTGKGRKRVILALSIVVAGLKYLALVMGPILAVVIAFFMLGTWLGLLESFHVNDGWVVIVACVLYPILHIADKNLDHKLEEGESSAD